MELKVGNYYTWKKNPFNGMKTQFVLEDLEEMIFIVQDTQQKIRICKKNINVSEIKEALGEWIEPETKKVRVYFYQLLTGDLYPSLFELSDFSDPQIPNKIPLYASVEMEIKKGERIF